MYSASCPAEVTLRPDGAVDGSSSLSPQPAMTVTTAAQAVAVLQHRVLEGVDVARTAFPLRTLEEESVTEIGSPKAVIAAPSNSPARCVSLNFILMVPLLAPYARLVPVSEGPGLDSNCRRFESRESGSLLTSLARVRIDTPRL